MSIAELLLPEWDNEMKVTRQVLERVPDDGDKGSWKPHEQSFPMAHLAQLVARMPGWSGLMLEQTEFDIAPKEGPKSAGYSIEKTAALLEEFDKASRARRDRETTDDAFRCRGTSRRGR